MHGPIFAAIYIALLDEYGIASAEGLRRSATGCRVDVARFGAGRHLRRGPASPPALRRGIGIPSRPAPRTRPTIPSIKV
jgi:hypothetical protein